MQENNQVRKFYDDLADDYHLMFADWREEVRRQGKILDALVRSQAKDPKTVLDCTCGIGTQAIGMAVQGYSVFATDLSPFAVARAIREGETFGVNIQGKAADIRNLDREVNETFDVVLSCDNSLSHLFDNEDLNRATAQMYACLRPGGLLIASIRDYDRLLEQGRLGSSVTVQQLPGEYGNGTSGLPNATHPRVFDDANGRRIVFQVWDWASDLGSYTINQFFVRNDQNGWQTLHRATRFRALLKKDLSEALRAAGCKDIVWHEPQKSGFYQPMVTARK